MRTQRAHREMNPEEMKKAGSAGLFVLQLQLALCLIG
jgi:hypothetical protein